MLEALGFEAGNIQTAAVCVYPAKVPVAVATLKKMGMENKINVASGSYEIHKCEHIIVEMIQITHYIFLFCSCHWLSFWSVSTGDTSCRNTLGSG